VQPVQFVPINFGFGLPFETFFILMLVFPSKILGIFSLGDAFTARIKAAWSAFHQLLPILKHFLQKVSEVK